jgi:hypothetical protein
MEPIPSHLTDSSVKPALGGPNGRMQHGQALVLV